MIFLFYLMVLALNSIQSVMSQEGNFAQFGVNAGDYRFTLMQKERILDMSSGSCQWLSQPLRREKTSTFW